VHRINFRRARPAISKIQLIDFYVVMIQIPPSRLRLRENRISIGSVKPCTADVEGCAEPVVSCPGPPADQVHRLDHLHRFSGGDQALGGTKTSRARTDNDNVDV
jgi:hypothetical protein